MNRFLVLAILVCLFAAVHVSVGGQGGFGMECVNGKCLVAASSSIWSTALSLLIAAFVIWFPRRRFTTASAAKPVLVWQRIGAMLMDFALIIFALTPAMSLPILLAEASYTGNFAWSFERKFARDTDMILTFPLIFAMFGALYFYHYLHMKHRIQTVGQYIAGYVVEGKTGPGSQPTFGLRVLLAWVGIGLWPVSLHYALKREDKSFWWENATDTRAVRVTLQKA